MTVTVDTQPVSSRDVLQAQFENAKAECERLGVELQQKREAVRGAERDYLAAEDQYCKRLLEYAEACGIPPGRITSGPWGI